MDVASRIGWALAGGIAFYLLLALFAEALELSGGVSMIFSALILGGAVFYHHFKVGEAEAKNRS